VSEAYLTRLPRLPLWTRAQDASEFVRPSEFDNVEPLRLAGDAAGVEALTRMSATGDATYRIPRGDLVLEESPFARGGTGEVYRGTYRETLTVAAKRLNGDGYAAAAADFAREVLTLASLQHPCVVSLYGLCADPEGDLMVLEYCGGGDLFRFHLSPRFTRAEFVRISRELLSGLAYLHGRGLAHLDFKPENVRF
jgi:hypothetical protein